MGLTKAERETIQNTHRIQAIAAHGHTWDLLEQKERRPKDDQEMIAAATID